MNKLFILLAFFCFNLSMNAQVPKTVNLTAAGTLSTVLSVDELNTITNLTLTGSIDARDFKTMRDLMPALVEINISEATIAAYSGVEGPVMYPGKFPANTVPVYAFFDKNDPWKGKTKLTSILLPESITALGKYCFYRSGLTSAVIPSSVDTIGVSAFGFCSSLTTVSIPSSVTSIGAFAFRDCNNLNSVIIPSSVTSIEEGTFSNCYKLTNVSIPSSVTSVGKAAFRECGSLTGIVIPSSVSFIGEIAFAGCDQLTSFTIPSSVTSLADGVFLNCMRLSSITIPASISSIGSRVFEGCAAIIEVDENNQTYSSLDGILYDKAQTTLIQCPTSKVGSVTIPSTVKSIGNKAFIDCDRLTTVIIPSSVTAIGEDAFYSSSVTSIVIPSTVTAIAANTFMNCTSLVSITIPPSVISIGNNAFINCSRLQSIEIPSSVTTIGNMAFDLCESLSKIFIPSSVISIGRAAFSGCTALIDIDTNNPIYSSLNSVIYNKDKTMLIQCPTTKSGKFVIPSSVTSIESGAFWECRHLTAISIPSSVVSIKKGAFSSSCYSLTSIIAANSIPIDLTSSVNIFDDINKATCTLYVPVGSRSAYQAADGWKDFTTIVEDPKIQTALKPTINAKQLTAYPNPTAGKVKLSFDHIPKRGTYLLVSDMTGRIILNQSVQHKEEWIDLKGNPPGIYFIKTSMEDGKVQRIVLK